jgi:hypothetical protein
VKAVGRWCLLFAIGVAAALSAGCVPVGVKIWERDILAKPEMQLDHAAVGAATVILAMGEGRRAAAAIHQYLQDGDWSGAPEPLQGAAGSVAVSPT